MVDLAHLTPKVFLGIAGVAVLCCLARPDYNLPLFAFAWLVWSENDPVLLT